MQPNVLVSLCLWIGVTDATAQEAGPRFTDVASEAGVDFQYHTGSRGQHDLVEIMGGGVALFDADGDGLLDIFVCDGCPIDPQSKQTDPPCRLFRNRGGFRFEDVTGDAGAPGPAYAMGAATGDFDGDGRVDLFVTGWRDQRLYRNMGGCRFRDVTAETGLNSTAWSTSAAFADLDGDGDIDIYVCNYLDFDGLKAPFCAAPDGRRDYCGPEVFASQRDRLYRNEGNSTFTEISEEAGIVDRDGRGLGLLVGDLTATGGSISSSRTTEQRRSFGTTRAGCGSAMPRRSAAWRGTRGARRWLAWALPGVTSTATACPI